MELPEHIGLLLLMAAVGEAFTVSVMLLDTVVQVVLDKLDTSGPTTTRYIPASETNALAIGKLLALVPAVPILLQLDPLLVLFCH